MVEGEPIYNLKEEEKETFKNDGVVWLPNVLNANRLQSILQCLSTDSNFENSGGNVNIAVLPYNKILYTLAVSWLPPIAAQLLPGSTEIYFYFDHFISKGPGVNLRTLWHQDQTYWPIRGPVLSIWIALDPITLENGGMEFIKGSHRFGKFVPQGFVEGKSGKLVVADDLVPMPDFTSYREKYKFLSKDMAPGDAVVFDSLIVHGAGGNRTENPRRGYSLRYFGESAIYFNGVNSLSFLKRADLSTGDKLTDYPLVYPRSTKDN